MFGVFIIIIIIFMYVCSFTTLTCNHLSFLYHTFSHCRVSGHQYECSSKRVSETNIQRKLTNVEVLNGCRCIYFCLTGKSLRLVKEKRTYLYSQVILNVSIQLSANLTYECLQLVSVDGTQSRPGWSSRATLDHAHVAYRGGSYRPKSVEFVL